MHTFIIQPDGFAETAAFFLADVAVRLAVLGFQNALRTNVVTGGNGVVLAFFVGPLFVPDPGVAVQTKELTATVGLDRTKQLTTDLGLLADQFAVALGAALGFALAADAGNNLVQHVN